MTKGSIFYTSPDSVEKDPISDYIDKFEFIPNSFGHQHDNPKAICNNRIIGDFELIFFVGGEGIVTINDSEYRCHKGDMIFIPPFTKHKIQTPFDNPHNNYWIHFDVYPLYKQDDFISAMTASGSNKTSLDCFDELHHLYALLEKRLENGSMGYYIIFKTILAQVIMFTLNSTPADTFCAEDKKSLYMAGIDIVNKCVGYIKEHISCPINITDLCSYLSISESYLYKSFIRVLGTSPSRFVNLYKIKKAEQLMKSTHISLTEISERLGFSSLYYFSNVFKKFYKMSPRDYLRMLNE